MASLIRRWGLGASGIERCAIPEGRRIAGDVALRGNGGAPAWTTADGTTERWRAGLPRRCIDEWAAPLRRFEVPWSCRLQRLPGVAGSCSGCPFGLDALARQRAE